MEYVVATPIEHDGVRYEPGETFPFQDQDILAPLIAVKALKLREEIESAAQLAADRAALEARNVELQAKYDALLAQVASKGKKAATATDDTPPPPAV